MTRIIFLLLIVALAGCSGKKGTLAELRQVEIVIERDESGATLDKAIESYEQFLDKAKDPDMTPEDIRRLADLKVEKEYGLLAEEPESKSKKAKQKPKKSRKKAEAVSTDKQSSSKKKVASSKRSNKLEPDTRESARTASARTRSKSESSAVPPEIDLKRVGAQEAVALYKQLLKDFPDYKQMV